MKKNIFKKTMCFALSSALSLSLLSGIFPLTSYAKDSAEELNTNSLVILSSIKGTRRKQPKACDMFLKHNQDSF